MMYEPSIILNRMLGLPARRDAARRHIFFPPKSRGSISILNFFPPNRGVHFYFYFYNFFPPNRGVHFYFENLCRCVLCRPLARLGSVFYNTDEFDKMYAFVCPPSSPTTTPSASSVRSLRRTDELDKIYPIRLSSTYPYLQPHRAPARFGV